MEHSLHILPVYSAYHPTEQRNGLRLLQHQVETLEAFNNPDIDLIINMAMTGDGKSLAAYLPVFEHDQHVIALYPTNELILDQYHALQNYEQKLHIRLPSHDMMDSNRITTFMRDHGTKVRLEEVRQFLAHQVLLTNPDLVHLIMSHQYGWDFQRKELAATTGANFDYFLFDKFHVFDLPQVISIVNMLGYLTANYREKPRERRKFLFLSATPSPLLERLLIQSGIRHKVIEGHYSTSEQSGQYRRILQPCEIVLDAISQEASTEDWIEGHLEELLSFFQLHQESKAAILVYSPATARRLLRRLGVYFAPYGITVGENSGLTPRETRRDALNKHILIGTSTVDIGIDFHINYLIFEAFSAGSFLQRFGRLGRHDEFSDYRAYGLVPRFILERLTTAFAGQHEMARTDFYAVIREAFPGEQEFSQYTRRWGVIQAAHVITEMQGQDKKDSNQAFRAALTEQYEHTYGTPGTPVMPKAVKKYWQLSKQCPEVLADLLHFRGQSPLQCGVWDTTVTDVHPGGHVLTYDLFFLLASTEFEVIEEHDFMDEVCLRALNVRDFQNKLLYLKIHAYVPERLHLILGLDLKLIEHFELLHHVAVYKGFHVLKPQHTWLDKVNLALKKLKLTAIVSDMQRQELKQRLQLSGVFPVYRLQDTMGSEYSVAFGQNALLLDSLLFFRKSKGDNAIMA